VSCFFQQKGMVISPSNRLNICMLRKHAHDGGMTTRCFDPGTYHIPWYPMLKRKMHYCSSSNPSTMLGTSNQLDGYGTGSFLKKSIVKWLSDCSPRRLSQNTNPPPQRKNMLFPEIDEHVWNELKLRISNTSGWWFQTRLFFHSVGNFIIPTDFHSIIFQRGRLKSPTRLFLIISHIS